MRTDGGGEHKTTNWSVILRNIALWSIAKCDVLVHNRTCPGNSAVNEVEGGNATLNLALEHQSSCREKMPQVLARHYTLPLYTLHTSTSYRSCTPLRS